MFPNCSTFSQFLQSYYFLEKKKCFPSCLQGRYDDRYNSNDNNRYNPNENYRYGERHNNDYPRYGENYDFDRNRNPYNDNNRPSNYNDDRSRDPTYNRYGSNYDDRSPNNNQYGNNYDDRSPNNNQYGNNYDDRNREQYYTNRNPYDDRNQYSNEDYDRSRLELERQNRLEDANLARLLDDVDELAAQECNINVGSQWNFETNVNEQTQQESVSSKEEENN